MHEMKLQNRKKISNIRNMAKNSEQKLVAYVSKNNLSFETH